MKKVRYEALLQQIKLVFSQRFGLHGDQASDTDIDNNIRAGVELVGATPWILIFAIFLASIGLNVNSTAVIIGAMLISPLMGPIMGMGYGVGIYDFALFKRSLINLAIATFISLTTATIYFLLSPLGEAQSELFARTTPTIWDVLIALFGGLAGMIGATRKERANNIIPGVAIATALMPPLCTAGFGLAHANWQFFFGALYLFTINCVFIAVSTTIVCGFLHLPQRKFVDPLLEKRVKRSLYLIVALTTLPSFYLAYQMVNDVIFKSQAQRFVRAELQFEGTHITDVNVSPQQRQIEVTLIGEPVSREVLSNIEAKLPGQGLSDTKLLIRQSDNGETIDLVALKENVISDLYQKSIVTINEKNSELEALRDSLSAMNASREAAADILKELQAQYPNIRQAEMAYAQSLASQASQNNEQIPILLISSQMTKTSEEGEKIIRWFKVRTKNEAAKVIFY